MCIFEEKLQIITKKSDFCFVWKQIFQAGKHSINLKVKWSVPNIIMLRISQSVNILCMRKYPYHVYHEMYVLLLITLEWGVGGSDLMVVTYTYAISSPPPPPLPHKQMWIRFRLVM